MNFVMKRLQAITSEQLEQPVKSLYLLVIVLQFLDALSTYWALSTGQAHEQNHLLVALAHIGQVDVMWIVVAAKFVVAAVFILAMQKNKATWTNLFVMFGMTAFYLHIVSDNISLTWRILDGRLLAL